MLTENDLIVQEKIVILMKKFFPDVKKFICEENFSLSKFKKIDFKKPFAVIDPIDGTENFYAENGMFGTLISINSKFSKKIDLIYLPAHNVLVTRENILSIYRKPKKNNNITMLSRMYGSTAFSFYKLITGEANEFIYCEGAKIWDCFTGLRLLKLINCKLMINNKNWKYKPKYKMKFKLRWN